MNTPSSADLILSMSRRRASAGILGLAATGFVIRSQAQSQRLHPTPRISEGPFYPDLMPADTDFDLLKNGNANFDRGQAVWLSGQVTDRAGIPVKGASVEIWQCDTDGLYLHSRSGASTSRGAGMGAGAASGVRLASGFQGFGRAAVDNEGRYRFRTIRPTIYPGRTPHIHVKVWVGNRDVLTTQLFVQGESGNARDFLWRSLNAADQQAVAVDFSSGGDSRVAQFPLVLNL